MDHDNVNRRLGAYLDGEVAEGERAGIERHLGECGVCAGELRDLRAVSQRVKGVAPLELDGGLRLRLHGAVERLGRRAAPQVERFVGLLLGIAACLAMVGGLMLMQPRAAEAVAPPDRWEGYATGIIDENANTTGVGTREAAIGEWMVLNLSTKDDSHE